MYGETELKDMYEMVKFLKLTGSPMTQINFIVHL